MATITVTADKNVDQLTWANGDTLVINNGATVTVNTDQTKYWKTITLTNGKLLITNSSTASGIRFLMGRISGSTVNALTSGSGLGTVEITGNWISLGTGTGVANQTVTSWTSDWIAALWVEKNYGYTVNATDGYVFDESSGTIVRSDPGGSFIDDGFENGMTLTVSGSTSNDGTYTISTVTATTITINSGTYTFTDETDATVTLKGVRSTGAEYEIWLNITDCGSTEVDEEFLQGFDAVTTGERGNFFEQSLVAEPYTAGNALKTQYGTTLTCGDGINGNTFPLGADIKMPNIMVTDESPANLQTATVNLECSFVFTSSGTFIANTALFDQCYMNFTQIGTCTLTDVGMVSQPLISECYNLNITRLGICIEPVRRISVSSVWTSRQRRWGNQVIWSYINGAVITDLSIVMMGASALIGTAPTVITGGLFQINNADNVTVTGARIFSLWRGRITNYALTLNLVNNCIFQDIVACGGCIALTDSSGNTFDNVRYADSMHDLCWSYVSAFRLTSLPQTGQKFLLDGTKYYLKTRSFRNWSDRSEYYQSRTYSFTPYSAGTNHPYFFSATCNGSTSVLLTWLRREPTHTSPAYEIYRYTTPGSAVRDGTTRLFTTNTTTTVTATDNGALLLGAPVNGTTYYYVLRKYDSAGVYTESAEQEVTPSANTTITNLCLQCNDFSNATWVKTNLTNTSNQANGPGDAIVGTATAFTMDQEAPTGNATATQVITGLSGSTMYTLVFYGMSTVTGRAFDVTLVDNAGAPVTATLTGATFTQKLTRYSLSITTGVGATQVTITFGANTTWTNGETVRLGAVWFVAGDGTNAYGLLTTTTGSVTLSPYTREITALNVRGKDGFEGVEVTLAAAPTGEQYCELYVGTDASFTPSANNRVGSTFAASAIPFYLIRSNQNTYRNITKLGYGGQAQTFISLTNSSNNRFIGFDWDFGGNNTILVNGSASSNNNFFHDMFIGDLRGYVATVYPIVALNNSQNYTFQNIRANTGHYDMPLTNQFLGCILKGFPAAKQDPATTVNQTTTLPTLGSTTDSVAIAYTAVFDTIFNELYQGATTGALHITFNKSSSDTPPYVLSGGASFSNTGRLYLPVAGASATYTWPHKIYGISGFRNKQYLSNGLDLGTDVKLNLLALVEYRINTGSGYGSWKEATGTNLSSEVVDATDGFYLEIRITARYGIKFDGQTSEFVLNETINGQTSGATAVVSAIEDGSPTGATGTLALTNLTPLTATPVSGINITFSTTQITRASGNFAADNYRVGGTVTVSGSASNDGTYFITAVAATALTVDAAHLLISAGAAGGITLTGSCAFVNNENIRSGVTVRALVNSGGAPLRSDYPQFSSYLDGLQIFTNVDQTVLYPEAEPTLTLTGLVAGTEVRVYNADTMVELGGVESSSTTFSMNYEYRGVDINSVIVIHALNYVPQRLTTILSDTDINIPVVQVVDRVYSNPI